MKATSTLRPRASSPRSVAGPSAITWPARHAVAAPHDGLLVDAGVLVRALELDQVVDVDVAGRRSASVTRPDDDAGGVDRLDHAVALGDHGRRRSRAPPPPPCRCRPAAPRPAAAAPPGAACSSPSARGWRRRSRGTGSATPPPRPAASARRPCTHLVGHQLELIHSRTRPALRQRVAPIAVHEA